VKMRITRISVHRTSLTLAIVNGALTLVAGLVVAVLGGSILPAGLHANPSAFSSIVVVPAIAFILGYVLSALCCWLYNVVSGRTGGMEFTVSE